MIWWFFLREGFIALLGRVRQAVASIIPSGKRPFSSSHVRRSSGFRLKGCKAGVSPGPVGLATLHVSAQTSKAGRPELVGVRMAGSQVACSRLIAATRKSCVESFEAGVRYQAAVRTSKLASLVTIIDRKSNNDCITTRVFKALKQR